MDDVLDFLIRNQGVVFGTLALLWSLALVNSFYLWRGQRLRRPADALRAIAVGAIAVFPLLWPRLSGQPLISPTAALEEPTLVKLVPHNHKLLILLHGWNGDSAGTWSLFPSLVANDPRLSSFDRWVVDYPTTILRRNLTIRQMSRWLNELMVMHGRYQQYNEIYVVAHSMGGLIAREMLLENRLARDNNAYKLLISIASPYQGADLGGLLSTLGLSRGFSDDLRPKSAMLANLRDNWNSLRDRPPTYCLTSPQDAVVSEDSAIFQCDEFLRYPQWGHSEMVKPMDLDDPRYQVPIFRVLRVESELTAKLKP